MKQLEWFDSCHVKSTTKKGNRYPKAQYNEAKDYNKRFKELMQQKKMK
jgi:hypothetical protein